MDRLGTIATRNQPKLRRRRRMDRIMSPIWQLLNIYEESTQVDVTAVERCVDFLLLGVIGRQTETSEPSTAFIHLPWMLQLFLPVVIGIPADDIRSGVDTQERVLLSSRRNLLSKQGKRCDIRWAYFAEAIIITLLMVTFCGDRAQGKVQRQTMTFSHHNNLWFA